MLCGRLMWQVGPVALLCALTGLPPLGRLCAAVACRPHLRCQSAPRSAFLQPRCRRLPAWSHPLWAHPVCPPQPVSHLGASHQSHQAHQSHQEPQVRSLGHRAFHLPRLSHHLVCRPPPRLVLEPQAHCRLSACPHQPQVSCCSVHARQARPVCCCMCARHTLCVVCTPACMRCVVHPRSGWHAAVNLHLSRNVLLLLQGQPRREASHPLVSPLLAPCLQASNPPRSAQPQGHPPPSPSTAGPAGQQGRAGAWWTCGGPSPTAASSLAAAGGRGDAGWRLACQSQCRATATAQRLAHSRWRRHSSSSSRLCGRRCIIEGSTLNWCILSLHCSISWPSPSSSWAGCEGGWVVCQGKPRTFGLFG